MCKFMKFIAALKCLPFLSLALIFAIPILLFEVAYADYAECYERSVCGDE